MMAENMNFYHYVQDWSTKIRSGRDRPRVFYAEAEYIHDCRKTDEGSRRGTDVAGIHAADLLLHAQPGTGAGYPGRPLRYRGGHVHPARIRAPDIGSIDMQVGLFRTEKGSVVKILCGFTVTREPGMHWQIFYGTEGTLENRRAPWEDAKIFRSGEGPMEAFPAEDSDPDAPAEALAGGHGTSEYYMVDRFRAGGDRPRGPVPIDVYRSLDFSVPGLCAHLSAQQGSVPVEVPDYRVG